jgi:hypothetical protein
MLCRNRRLWGCLPQTAIRHITLWNLRLGRGCIDRNVLRRGRVCREVHCFPVTWSLFSGCRSWRDFDTRYKTLHLFTYFYVLSVHYIHTEQTEWTLLLCSGYTQYTLWLALALWLSLHYSSQRLGSPSPSPRVKLSVCLTLSLWIVQYIAETLTWLENRGLLLARADDGLHGTTPRKQRLT